MNTTALPRTCSYALLNIVKNIIVRRGTTVTKPEPEPEPDHRTSIRIKRWVTRERHIGMEPYYGLASQPLVVEGRTS